MAFVKGQSGNPGGRSKKRAELAITISEMDDVYRQRLHLIATQGEHKESIAAIKLLWGYAHGLPTQVVTGEDGAPLIPAIGAETIDALRRLGGK